MENYIVRIYQQDPDRGILAGIVEIVRSQEKKPFNSRDELLAILGAAAPDSNIVWDTKHRNKLKPSH